MHAYERDVYDMAAYEMPVYERHAYGMAPVRSTPERRAYERHAWEAVFGLAILWACKSGERGVGREREGGEMNVEKLRRSLRRSCTSG